MVNGLRESSGSCMDNAIKNFGPRFAPPFAAGCITFDALVIGPGKLLNNMIPTIRERLNRLGSFTASSIGYLAAQLPFDLLAFEGLRQIGAGAGVMANTPAAVPTWSIFNPNAWIPNISSGAAAIAQPAAVAMPVAAAANVAGGGVFAAAMSGDDASGGGQRPELTEVLRIVESCRSGLKFVDDLKFEAKAGKILDDVKGQLEGGAPIPMIKNRLRRLTTKADEIGASNLARQLESLVRLLDNIDSRNAIITETLRLGGRGGRIISKKVYFGR